MIKTLLFILASAFLTSSANAFINVCELQSRPVNSFSVNQEAIRNYQQKLANECRLATQYKNLQADLAKSSVGVEQVSLYQAMRFVQKSWFDRAEAKNLPIQKVYQTTRAAGTWPVERRSTEIWDNWYSGIQQLRTVRASLVAGNQFTLDDLKQVHRGLFTVSDERGDFAHDPHPGVLKAHESDMPWWTFNSEGERQAAELAVSALDAKYRALNLLPALPLGMPIGSEKLLNIKANAIYAGVAKMNPLHLEIYFNFLNAMLNQARAGQHMVWQNELFTPAELAFFIQQYYVAMHPFFEGNGRTSRFMQEMVLTLFGLPHGNSGDLMDDDVLTPHAQYYSLALKKTSELLSSVESCASEYAKALKKTGDLRSSKAVKRLSYKCRLVN